MVLNYPNYQLQERSRGVPVGLVDLFAHTHAARQVDDAGNITYEWGEHDRATEAYVSVF